MPTPNDGRVSLPTLEAMKLIGKEIAFEAAEKVGERLIGSHINTCPGRAAAVGGGRRKRHRAPQARGVGALGLGRDCLWHAVRGGPMGVDEGRRDAAGRCARASRDGPGGPLTRKAGSACRTG